MLLCWWLTVALSCSAMFMELPVDNGMLSGPLPGRIAGIVGFDVFARTIVEIPASESHAARASGSSAAALDAARDARALKPGTLAAGPAGARGNKQRASAVARPEWHGPSDEGLVRLLPPYSRLADMPPWMQALDWQPLRVVRSRIRLHLETTLLSALFATVQIYLVG
jgi:hypothetical protein